MSHDHDHSNDLNEYTKEELEGVVIEMGSRIVAMKHELALFQNNAVLTRRTIEKLLVNTDDVVQVDVSDLNMFEDPSDAETKITAIEVFRSADGIDMRPFKDNS